MNDTTHELRSLVDDLHLLLARRAPHQFVTTTLWDPITAICRRLGLPQPTVMAGNIVIGDPRTAVVALSAHLDEASFAVTAVEQDQVRLAACHRLPDHLSMARVSFLGFRDERPTPLGETALTRSETGTLHAGPLRGIRLGDRALYSQQISHIGHQFCASAIDDRAGAVIALSAAARLQRTRTPTVVVLSDGEQNLPEGYFSRTFPHILGQLHPKARIIFCDGIFHRDLQRGGYQHPPARALIVPHSGDGAGYSVPPALFAWLRDDAVPRARAAGIDVDITHARHSRGDDWGMVTNPTSGADRAAMFVSFGGQGESPGKRVIDVRCLQQCVDFIAFAAPQLP